MKITNYSISNYASKDVASQPDILTGTVAQNKAVFDKLSKEVIVPAFNNLAAAVANASVIGGLGSDSIINNLSGLYHITANLLIKNASLMANVSLTRGDLINVFSFNETSFSLVRFGLDGTIKIYTFGPISITLVSEFTTKSYVDSNIMANLTQANNYTDGKIATVTGLANAAQTTANSAVSGVQAINNDKGVGIATLTDGKLTPSQIPTINGHNLVVMTQAEYDAAVKDENTIYLV